MDVRKEKVVKILKITLVTIILVMVSESLMMISYIETPLIKDISSLKDKIIFAYFCEKNVQECNYDWRQWLGLSNMPQSYLLLDLIYLYLVLLTK